MLNRVVGQHDSDIRNAGGNQGGKRVSRRFGNQHNRALARGHGISLGIPDHTQLSGFWHIAHHHRQRLACSMLAFTQLVNRAVVAGITSQVKSSDSLDSKNLPVSQ